MLKGEKVRILSGREKVRIFSLKSESRETSEVSPNSEEKGDESQTSEEKKVKYYTIKVRVLRWSQIGQVLIFHIWL